MRDTPFMPHGRNYQWDHKRLFSANERMQMNFRFRLGLSPAWPPPNYQPQN